MGCNLRALQHYKEILYPTVCFLNKEKTRFEDVKHQMIMELGKISKFKLTDKAYGKRKENSLTLRIGSRVVSLY